MLTLDVDVFLADMRDHDCEAMAGQLSPGGLARLARITHPRRRAQFILGRRLLDHALRELYGAAAEEWRLDAAAGKPCLIGVGVPEISLAHSRELVACAIARVEIGLDLEYCKERDFTALAEQICTPAEFQRFLLLPAAERCARFYQLWALEEATFKLHGREVPLADRDTRVRHEYFLPAERYLAALTARTADQLQLVVHPLLPRESALKP